MVVPRKRCAYDFVPATKSASMTGSGVRSGPTVAGPIEASIEYCCPCTETGGSIVNSSTPVNPVGTTGRRSGTKVRPARLLTAAKVTFDQPVGRSPGCGGGAPTFKFATLPRFVVIL